MAEVEDTLQCAFERKLDPDYYVTQYVIAFLKSDKVAMERETALAGKRHGTENWLSNVEAFVLFGALAMRPEGCPIFGADWGLQNRRRDMEALYEADGSVREALFGNASTARKRAAHALELSKMRDVVLLKNRTRATRHCRKSSKIVR